MLAKSAVTRAQAKEWSKFLLTLDSAACAADTLEEFWPLAVASLMRTKETVESLMADFADEADALRYNLKCANCRSEVSAATPYCSDFCRDLAAIVRYGRKANAEGRSNHPDFLEGFGISFIKVLKGGYSVKARRLTATQRSAIFARDAGICRLCGAKADQIDHISGDSSEANNLRAVCGPCNLKLAHAPDLDATPEENAAWRSNGIGLSQTLADRIGASNPLMACDDHKIWKLAEPKIRGARSRLVRERQEELDGEFEDVDDYLWHAMQKDD